MRGHTPPPHRPCSGKPPSALSQSAQAQEEEAAIKLYKPVEKKVTIVDLSYLSRGTEKEQAEAAEIRVRSGVVTPNEVRESIGMNHGPAELDRHFILTTVQSVEKALAPAPGSIVPAPEQDPEIDITEDGQIGTDPTARATLTVVLARALRDHDRRWKARSKDLCENVTPADLDARLSAAREELRGKLASDLAEFVPMAEAIRLPFNPAALAEAVEAGAAPHAVAAHHFEV